MSLQSQICYESTAKFSLNRCASRCAKQSTWCCLCLYFISVFYLCRFLPLACVGDLLCLTLSTCTMGSLAQFYALFFAITLSLAFICHEAVGHGASANPGVALSSVMNSSFPCGPALVEEYRQVYRLNCTPHTALMTSPFTGPPVGKEDWTTAADFLRCLRFCSQMHSPGRCLAHLVERAPHVPRLCSGPGFDSRPGSLCCVSLPLSLPLSCHIFILSINKAMEGQKQNIKKNKKNA